MAQSDLAGRNREFPIYNADGTPFHGLTLHKSTYESVVMSLGDKITGDVYYPNNHLTVTMAEYIVHEGVRYALVNPPTIVREGMVADNGSLKGMTKYSFTFYHPMYMLSAIPFTDVAVSADEAQYLSESKTFYWIGTCFDFIAKLNKNLAETVWVVDASTNAESRAKMGVMSDVLSFDNTFIGDALKTAYDTWAVPFVIEQIDVEDEAYTAGKRFRITFGLPSNTIVDGQGNEYMFQMGQGVGLKNNSRTPRNNKIVTRIVGYGSEGNIPYGYPQIVWTGDASWNYTINNAPGMQETTVGGETVTAMSYPIYNGIVGGQTVRLIKHPFTRTHLMPSVYAATVNRKVNPLAEDYDPDTTLVDYYDAPVTYPNPIVAEAPSVEYHEFSDIKPQLGEARIVAVTPYNTAKEIGAAGVATYDTFMSGLEATIMSDVTNENERSALMYLYDRLYRGIGDFHAENNGGSYTYQCDVTSDTDYYFVKYTSDNVNIDTAVIKDGHTPPVVWDDTMDDDGNYRQSYFKVTLPVLSFDLYACAAITEKMQVNMRSGACLGCTFEVQVDWEDYKRNFYTADGVFDPVIGTGHPRDGVKYPDSRQTQLTVILKKDLETFGTLMPNVYQHPQGESAAGADDGDEFVILGISLPLSYITTAEQDLDDAMMEYMLENNVHYYDYPLKFDEYFLATHTDILAQIHNNTVVKFLFGNEAPMKLYVKQITVKYGEKPLPEYDITLTDDVEVVLNQLGQVTDDVSRVRVELSELQKYYSEDLLSGIEARLSRVTDDVAQGRITFQEGLAAVGNIILHDDIRSADYDTGLYEGTGWRIDHLGNAEMESLRVRSYLEVVELLINRLRAQEGDTMFTDNDQVDKVEEKEYNGTTYYILSLKEKWDGYVTAQEPDNILRGIVNTLAASAGQVSDVDENECVEEDGDNKYYTSWMKVIDPSDVNESVGTNQIVVTLYGDTDVPAGKNFAPCELMTLARWGCDADPDDATLTAEERESIIRRQNVFSISTTDGRIAKLRGVRTPELQPTNYGTTLGTIPDFINQWSIASRLSPTRDYLYAQGVIVSDFIKVDALGDPITNYVDAGEWQPNTPYLHNAYNAQNLQWETNDVWHDGSYWRCLVTQPYNGVYYEPTDANHLYWQRLMRSGEDGQPAPFYTQEWYAWSNVQSVVSATTEPTPNSGWQTTIASQGSYAYLWRKSIRYVWSAQTDAYVADAAQYFRMSGTNGTSINVKGSVATVSALPSTHADGDAYVVDADGHLYMWSDEAADWVDLGEFKGEDGRTYYTHIAWATAVTYNTTTGVVTSVEGFTITRLPSDTTHYWMGVLVNESSSTDSSDALLYTWSYTKGVDGTSPMTMDLDNEMDGVRTDEKGKVVTATSIVTNARLYDGATPVTAGVTAAAATLCGVTATPTITDGVATYGWTIPTTYTFTGGRATVTLTLTYNGRDYTKVFTLMATMGSAVYNLIPSVTAVNVGRTAAGGYDPSSSSITIGYMKSVAGTITTVTSATSTIDSTYRVFFRRRTRSTQAWSNYYWYGNATYRAYLTTFDCATYDRVEIILYRNTSSSSMSSINESYVIDRESVPVVADGVRGADGASIQAQYAPSSSPASSDIHDTWQAGDLYMRTRPTTGTWSSWMKVVGEEGDETVYAFAISSAMTTAGATTPPADITTWADAPVATTTERPYLWARVQQRTFTDGVPTVTSTTYIRLTGERGERGGNTAIVYLYNRSDTAVTSHGINVPLYYRFTTKRLYTDAECTVEQTVTNGWSQALPTGTSPLYVIAATAFAYTDTDDIAYGEWSVPVALSQNGSDGLNAAAVFLYQRAAATPSKPSGTLTYTFATGVLSGTLGSWTQTIPTADGSPCYVIQATAVGSGTTDTIESSEWSTQRVLVEDGRHAPYVELSRRTILYTATNAGASTSQQNFAVTYALKTDGNTCTIASASAVTITTPSGVTVVSGTKTTTGVTLRVANNGTPSGVVTITMTGTYGGNTYTASATIEVEANREGAQGQDGAQGKVGRFFYYAGDFQSGSTTVHYTVSDAEAPYFRYNNNYWVFNPEENGSYTPAQMGNPSNQSANWVLMTSDFKYILSEAIFTDSARLGSSYIAGDWQISTYGTLYDANGNATVIDDTGSVPIGGVTYNKTNAYSKFNANYPNSSQSGAVNFVPNYAIDLLTGTSFQHDAYVSGEIHATSGDFVDVTISGGMRSPFIILNPNDAFSDKSDNIALVSASDGTTNYVLPWSASQSGRKIVIANTAWYGNLGRVTITAGSGSVFFEDGLTKQSITLGRECVELIGYIDRSAYWQSSGWIVLKRTSLDEQTGLYRTGREMKILAYGKFSYTGVGSPAYTLTYKTFDGTTFGSPTRNSTGSYTISWNNNNWFASVDEVFCMVTGVGNAYGRANGVYAQVASTTKTSVTIRTADDDTANDGSFNFVIMNLGQFDSLI